MSHTGSTYTRKSARTRSELIINYQKTRNNGRILVWTDDRTFQRVTNYNRQSQFKVRNKTMENLKLFQSVLLLLYVM